MKTTEYPSFSSGLDYYKATMGQLEFLKHPDVRVTFTLKNRASEQLSRFVSTDELQQRLDTMQDGWQPDEVAFLASLQNQDGDAQFTPEYLDFLVDNSLPPVDISTNEQGDISAETTGSWPLVTFWETVVMSEINELYFKNKCEAEGTSLSGLYEEGDKRLSEKIAQLKNHPDIKFSDFGTRRRFSYQWQKHVIERLATELPDNFVGTSNIYLAWQLGLKPIGTFAHELPMVYAALSDEAGENPLSGHGKALDDWQALYKSDLSTALTDTFTTDFFFEDFGEHGAKTWNSLRHDSGDPYLFGEKVIAFYEQHDVDPLERSIVFSDGLDIDTIVALSDYFKGRIQLLFGWGTTLTNDLGLKPLNIVMKATKAGETSTVKLSDDEGKHTGTPEKITLYKNRIEEALASRATKDLVLL